MPNWKIRCLKVHIRVDNLSQYFVDSDKREEYSQHKQ